MAAKVEFNVNWWKKNSATTLTGTGMSEALRDWEKDKKSDDKIKDALKDLAAAAKAAEAKANSKLHKETIGYLKAYQTKCADFLDQIKTAEAKTFPPDMVLSKPMLTAIGATKRGKMFLAELQYLFVTKGNPKKASAGVYDTFIKAGAKEEVNVDAPTKKKCADLAAAGTWEDEGWKDARDEVMKLTFDKKNLAALKDGVLIPLELEPVYNEIRAA